MSGPGYEVVWTKHAKTMLAAIGDKRTQRIIVEKAEQLADEPELQGKPLLHDLAGYRSVRAAGQRYRIIYKIEKKNIFVIIVAVGIRKGEEKADIYRLAKKLIRTGLMDLED